MRRCEYKELNRDRSYQWDHEGRSTPRVRFVASPGGFTMQF